MNNKTKNKNRLSFFIILLFLPFLLLAVLEGVLRISGFGKTYPLFIEAKSPQGYLQQNPELIKRYFSDPDSAPAISPDTTYFKKQKPEGLFRIIVQGGSSAAGFPYGRFGSLSGMLQQRFKRQYPDKEIEIINTAMSAVNSYTMLDIVDEIIAVQPDLILIYAGHNEYLGVMGAGSSMAARGGREATLLFLKFKELRLYQLMQRVMQLFITKPTLANSTDRTLMADIASGQKIVFNSDLYHRGLEQFSNNLDLILSNYKAKNIPVVLGTLASNEKDQKPFASTEGEYSANAIYHRANELLDNGQYLQARTQFQTARDRDLLRFRAPSSFNNIIREKAEAKSIYIAESEAKIRLDSRDKIIGFQHMLEHLHPNERGYFLLAEAFAEVVSVNQLMGGAVNNYPIEQAWLDIPLTQVDKIIASKKITQLTSDYPFSEQQRPNINLNTTSYDYTIAEQRLAGSDWLVTMQDMLQTYQQQNRATEAAKVAGLIFDAFPDLHQVAYVAGQLYFRNNDISMALYYHDKALSLEPENVNYLLMTARSNYANAKLDASIQLLQRAIVLAPENRQARSQLQRIKAELNNEN